MPRFSLFSKSFFLMSAVAALAGCSGTPLERLRRAEMSGSAFDRALADGYRAFAEREQSNYDWIDSGHFARKGLAAAYGQGVEPEDPNMWDVPDEVLPELESARAGLLEALKTGAMNQKPEMMADAVVAYDCWVEEQEEQWQRDLINACRMDFYQAVEQLTGKKAPMSAMVAQQGKAPASLPNDGGALKLQLRAKKPGKAGKSSQDDFDTLSTSYMIFFAAGSAQIDEEGVAIIANVLADLEESKKNLKDFEITLSGHSDTLGPAKENMRISRVRAEAVRSRLTQVGIPADIIAVNAYGETRLRVKTGDNVANRANRRVEIYVKP